MKPNGVLPEQKAMDVAKRIESILTENGIHYRLVMDKQPDLRFVEFERISIKIARG